MCSLKTLTLLLVLFCGGLASASTSILGQSLRFCALTRQALVGYHVDWVTGVTDQSPFTDGILLVRLAGGPIKGKLTNLDGGTIADFHREVDTALHGVGSATVRAQRFNNLATKWGLSDRQMLSIVTAHLLANPVLQQQHQDIFPLAQLRGHAAQLKYEHFFQHNPRLRARFEYYNRQLNPEGKTQAQKSVAEMRAELITLGDTAITEQQIYREIADLHRWIELALDRPLTPLERATAAGLLPPATTLPSSITTMAQMVTFLRDHNVTWQNIGQNFGFTEQALRFYQHHVNAETRNVSWDRNLLYNGRSTPEREVLTALETQGLTHWEIADRLNELPIVTEGGNRGPRLPNDPDFRTQGSVAKKLAPGNSAQQRTPITIGGHTLVDDHGELQWPGAIQWMLTQSGTNVTGWLGDKALVGRLAKTLGVSPEAVREHVRRYGPQLSEGLPRSLHRFLDGGVAIGGNPSAGIPPTRPSIISAPPLSPFPDGPPGAPSMISHSPHTEYADVAKNFVGKTGAIQAFAVSGPGKKDGALPYFSKSAQETILSELAEHIKGDTRTALLAAMGSLNASPSVGLMAVKGFEKPGQEIFNMLTMVIQAHNMQLGPENISEHLDVNHLATKEGVLKIVRALQRESNPKLKHFDKFLVVAEGDGSSKVTGGITAFLAPPDKATSILPGIWTRTRESLNTLTGHIKGDIGKKLQEDLDAIGMGSAAIADGLKGQVKPAHDVFQALILIIEAHNRQLGDAKKTEHFDISLLDTPEGVQKLIQDLTLAANPELAYLPKFEDKTLNGGFKIFTPGRGRDSFLATLDEGGGNLKEALLGELTAHIKGENREGLDDLPIVKSTLNNASKGKPKAVKDIFFSLTTIIEAHNKQVGDKAEDNG